MQNSRLVRISVVAFSSLLAGGYVLYSVADQIMPSSKSGRILPASLPSQLPEPGPATQPGAPPATNPAPGDPLPTQPAIRFMPGSKSLNHVIDGDNILYKDGFTLDPPATPPTTHPATAPSINTPQTRRRMLYSPKSAPIFEPETAPQQEAPKP